LNYKTYIKINVKISIPIPYLDGIENQLTLTTCWHKLAEKRNWCHTEEAAQPDECNYLVGMIDGLPSARPQRMADGIVTFTGYSDQSPRGDSHR